MFNVECLKINEQDGFCNNNKTQKDLYDLRVRL
jgi:hypothetical protein